jgi:hypothetical protein
MERLSKATKISVLTAGNTTATAPAPECRPAGSCAKASCQEDVTRDRTFLLIPVSQTNIMVAKKGESVFSGTWLWLSPLIGAQGYFLFVLVS